MLREAYLNQMWPKCDRSNPPEAQLNQQLHESVSMASINDPEESSLF